MDSLMRSGSSVSAVACHISTRVAAAASMPATATTIASQRAALRRRDDAVETHRAASFDGPVREVPPDSKRLPTDSVALMLWIIVELTGGDGEHFAGA